MDRIELEAKKAMLAREILNTENEELLNDIISLLIKYEGDRNNSFYKHKDIISTLQEPMTVLDAKDLDLDSEELESIIDNLPFERIPGLPYTHEERMASLRRAEEQHRLGLFISSDELDEEMKSW
ncbi:hypothetical protein M2480_000502 [Parabacteroides sp. PFB2-12]|uniref:hypothetical protein n=1 Tax=unclassified Parabacteroides TaxID=2649774 RepID=UPI002476D58B|nr:MULTISPECIES: hypothetical protein [unclassified Parabacteroides]MDH6342123.1 hypothetical protein [Parabacteroides sp. PM6-13]MDH6389542.1 hypothetical protein [Parabacteroides sp. PFB2-12]